MTVADVSPHVVRVIALVLGLASGALAARLADALPLRYGITHLAKGTARAKRNAVVLALSAACAVGVGELVVRAPAAPLAVGALFLVVNVVLVSLLVAAAAVDLEHMILPDELTFSGTLLAVASAPFLRIGLAGALIGGAVGLAIAYLPFLFYKKLRGHSGMGLGDAKLLVLIGAWQGVSGALFVLFAGALQSVLAAVVLRLSGRSFGTPESVAAELRDLRARAEAGDKEAEELLGDDPMAAEEKDTLLGTRLPLGPFLALGAVELVFARPWIAAAYAYFASL
jgi:leader peptidase (prepilin peptidase) / N-methyltransferase